MKTVCEPEGYVSGKAFEVRYELTDDKGKVVEYREIFFNDEYNERTCRFLDHLESNGVATLTDFIGREEKIEILYDVNNNRRRPRIVDRKFICESDE